MQHLYFYFYRLQKFSLSPYLYMWSEHWCTVKQKILLCLSRNSAALN